MTTETATTITKSVKYNRETRDYAGYLAIDGQVIIDQDFNTAQAAQSAVDNAAYDYLASLDAAAEPAICCHCDRPLAAGESEACSRCYVDPEAIPMAAPVVSAFPIITRQNVGAALRTAREKAAADKAWTNALNKAAVELEAQPWRFNGKTLVIHSRTESALKHTTDGTTCTCKAFNQETPRPCWHRAAALLLQRAASRSTQPAR